MDVGLVILFGFSGLLGAFAIAFAAMIAGMIKERALAAPKRRLTSSAAASSTPVAAPAQIAPR